MLLGPAGKRIVLTFICAVVLPVGFLWALVALLRLVLGSGFARAPERWFEERIRPPTA